MKKVLLLCLLVLAPLAWGDDVNRVATYCKQQWPGDKGMQSYCLKTQRDYMDWVAFIRKRVFRDDNARYRMDACVDKYSPDYQRAFNCYWK